MEIECLSLYKRPKDNFWTISENSEKYEMALKLKEKGNEILKSQGDSLKARNLYSSASKILSLNTKEEIRNLYCTSLLNSALCNLKISDSQAAKENCEEVLKYDSSSIKALYRLGKAELQLGEFENAKESFEKGLKLDSKNTEISKELQNLKDLKKKETEKEKNFYGKMFS